MRLASFAIATALGIAAACSKDSSGPPPPPPPQRIVGPATGPWIANGPTFTTAVDLIDTILSTTRVGAITGSGSLTGPGGTKNFLVFGTDSSRSILLIFRAANFLPAYFTGHMLGDTAIQGSLDSSGFAHVALKFIRPVIYSSP